MCFFTTGDANIYQIKNLFEFPNSVDKILRFCRDGDRAFLGVSEDYAATSGEDQVVKVPGIFFFGQTSKNTDAKGGMSDLCLLVHGIFMDLLWW